MTKNIIEAVALQDANSAEDLIAEALNSRLAEALEEAYTDVQKAMKLGATSKPREYRGKTLAANPDREFGRSKAAGELLANHPKAIKAYDGAQRRRMDTDDSRLNQDKKDFGGDKPNGSKALFKRLKYGNPQNDKILDSLNTLRGPVKKLPS